MKIVVGGYIVGLPIAGMSWHHLNYLIGLAELGHEVVFLEDSGPYTYPWDPENWENGSDSSYGRRYLEEALDRHGISRVRWCYYSEFEDRHYGLTREELHDALRAADLMICVSGVTPMRDDRPRVKRTCVIDTDPVFTQLKMLTDEVHRKYYLAFDEIATFGVLIGTPACTLPMFGRHWVPTQQPIAMSHWPAVPNTSKAFSTIGTWEHTSDRHFEYEGQHFLSNKSIEWMKLLNLPSRTRWEMRMSMSNIPPDVQKRFAAAGWGFDDPWQISHSPQTYRDFIQSRAGEFTVAKQIYAGLPSGWFSDRSAAFLASGRPVITQSSGFEQWLPTGEGLFSFATLDEAAAALDAIAADYPRHARSARRIAEEHFDARTVLPDLLERIA